MEIRELSSKEKFYIDDIVNYEIEIFGDGGIGRWTIMPFIRYGKIYVLLEDEKIVSVVEIMRTFDTNEAYIYGFFTKKEFTGKGYASILLDFTIDKMKQSGIKKLTLTVDPKNEKAIKLYFKHGFIEKELLVEEYGKDEDRLYLELVL